MGSEELADNLFRIVQTEAKLKNEKINNEYDANITHQEVGKAVRETINLARKFANAIKINSQNRIRRIKQNR